MEKTASKIVFWLFWTISPKRMGLMIWLGAFFLLTLGLTSCSLAELFQVASKLKIKQH
jgi:hypothetical protein